MEDEEYDLSGSEDESAPRVSTASDNLKDENEAVRALDSMSKAPGSELESEHSEWFKVEPDDLETPEKADDSETEDDHDSDNHDSNEDDGDEWFSVPGESQVKSEVKVVTSIKMETQTSDGFDVVEAPQTHDTIVGFAPLQTLTSVQPPDPDEAGNERGNQDGRRR